VSSGRYGTVVAVCAGRAHKAAGSGRLIDATEDPEFHFRSNVSDAPAASTRTRPRADRLATRRPDTPGTDGRNHR
jgi:hypothetical protein